MSENNKIGIFYLIYPSEYSKKDLPVYKLGIHQNLDQKVSYKRYNCYEDGSEIIYYFKINYLYQNESKAIKKLTTDGFKYERGREYFTGNLLTIFNKIYEVIKNDIIELCNLDNDIFFHSKYNTFRKINIYFDEKINKKYLNYLKEKFNENEIINNYEYRMSHLKYLLNNYKNDVLCENGELFVVNTNKTEELIETKEVDTNNKTEELLLNNETKELIINNETKEIINNEPEKLVLNNETNKLVLNNENKELIVNNENKKNMIDENHKINIKNIKFTKENSGYICHRCFYIAFKTYDMNKHLNKKNLCKSQYNCPYNDLEYKILSIKKRYYFNGKKINISKNNFLIKNQLIILVTEYNNELNIISKLSNLTNKISIENSIINENIENSIISENIENSIISENIENNINKNEHISKEDYIIYENGERRFMCPRCKTKYKRKENLEEHVQNKRGCDKKFYLNQMILEIEKENK